jgi:hypothetical protein
LEVFVNVPFRKTTCLLLRVPPESEIAEMFIPVMFTESPSAAWEGAIGNARSPKVNAAITKDLRGPSPS